MMNAASVGSVGRPVHFSTVELQARAWAHTPLATILTGCMTRAYRGCPEGPEGEKQEQDSTYGLVTVSGLPIFDPRVAAEHKKLGWKKG